VERTSLGITRFQPVTRAIVLNIDEHALQTIFDDMIFNHIFFFTFERKIITRFTRKGRIQIQVRLFKFYQSSFLKYPLLSNDNR
jgi:hypothetical protein